MVIIRVQSEWDGKKILIKTLSQSGYVEFIGKDVQSMYFVQVARPTDHISLLCFCINQMYSALGLGKDCKPGEKWPTDLLIPSDLAERESYALNYFRYYRTSWRPAIANDPPLLHFRHIRKIVSDFLYSLREEVVKSIKEQLEPSSNSRYALKKIMHIFQVCLATGDETGEVIARQRLEEEMQRIWVGTIELEAVNFELQRIWNGIGSTDAMDGWVAFFVGNFCQDWGNKISWLEKCFSLAQTPTLRLYASRALVYSNLFVCKYRESLVWCKRQLEAASDLGNIEYICHALQNACQTYLRAGMLEEAHQVLGSLRKMVDKYPGQVFHEVVWLTMYSEISYLMNDMEGCLSACNKASDIARDFHMDKEDHVVTYLDCEENDDSFMVITSVYNCLQRVALVRDKVEMMARPSSLEFRNEDLGSQAHTFLMKGMLLEAEVCAAQWLEEVHDSSHNIRIGAALMLLAEIRYAYSREGHEKEEALQIIDSLMFEAERLVPGLCKLTIQNIHAELSFKLRYTKHTTMFGEELGILYKTQIEVKEDGVSGRISYTESVRDGFRMMEEATLLEKLKSDAFDDDTALIRRAVVWSERGRARTLISNRLLPCIGIELDSVKKQISVLDTSVSDAWKEIQSTCDLAGDDTTFLVYNSLNTSCEILLFCYFLHSHDEPCFQECRVPREMITRFIPRNRLEDCKYLFRVLIKPWKDKLVGTRKIIIVPTEELSTFPFAALYDEEENKYLIQTFSIAIIPSLRMFRQCNTKREHSTSEISPRRALVIGNPTNDLPKAEKEAEFVAETLERMEYDPVILKREKATAEAVMQFLPSAAWIHISGHAVVNLNCPYGAIILAPAASDNANSSFNSGQIRDRVLEAFCQHATFFDGKLTGDKIEELGELKARVAMLSACNTGLGEACAEGILGFCRSFHMTGVPAVVVSLWPLKDSSTKTVMENVYRNLENGMDLLVAFQEAMKSMIKLRTKFGHPEFPPEQWAAFVVSGC